VQFSQSNIWFPGWGSLRSTRSRADPTGGWRTYSEEELNAALKLIAIVYRLKVSRSLTNITEKSSTNPVCSQPKMTVRNNEELRAQCRPSARDESNSCHSASWWCQNCWSVIAALKPYCQRLESTLDWFHIGKKFQTVKQALGDSFEDSLESNGTCGMAMLRRALPN